MHYFDLTEDMATTHAIRTLAASAGAVMIPQNGLAPGFIGMVGAYLAQQFESGTLRRLKLRVGAVPQRPTGQLGYAVNWSPEGLLRSYTAACDVLVHGKRHQVPALSNPEILRIGGVTYEASPRPAGWAPWQKPMRAPSKRSTTKAFAIPAISLACSCSSRICALRTHPVSLCSGCGRRCRQTKPTGYWCTPQRRATTRGPYRPRPWSWTIAQSTMGHRTRTAIAWTTAASLVAVVELVSQGTLPQRGFVKQEAIPLRAFLHTTTGHLCAEHHPALQAL